MDKGFWIFVFIVFVYGAAFFSGYEYAQEEYQPKIEELEIKVYDLEEQKTVLEELEVKYCHDINYEKAFCKAVLEKENEEWERRMNEFFNARHTETPKKSIKDKAVIFLEKCKKALFKK